MSAKGLAFTDYFLGRYSFTDCIPGEYTYRIELLEKSSYHPESQHYFEFMEENGAERILSWHRWTYFRKRSEGGKFEIYNDIGSRISHYKRVSTLYLCLGAMNIGIGCVQLDSAIGYFLSGDTPAFTIFLLGLLWSMGLIFLLLWNSYRKKIKKLKQEKKVWE